MGKLTGYLGTYESKESHGVYRFTLDTERGELSRPRLFFKAADVKYISQEAGLLAAPVQEEGKAGLFLLDTIHAGEETGEKKSADFIFQEKTAACFVTQDKGRIFTANYHEGTIFIYHRGQDGPVPEARIETGRESGCHQVLLCGRYMLAFCLLQDRIYLYDSRSDWRLSGEISFPKGTGPRHGILDKEKERLFVVSERSNEVFVFRIARERGEKISFCQTFSGRIPGEGAGEAPATAAVRLSPDGRFLYTSTRFSDVLTGYGIDGFSLSLVQQTGSGGRGPRDFVITGDGRYLLAANRTEGGLVLFRLDPKTGRIGESCCQAPAPQGVSLVLEE